MKYFSLNFLLVFVFFISSCSNIVYLEAVPMESESLNSFPKNILGKYIDDEGDTLSINIDNYTYGNSRELVYLTGTLNDELVLKTYLDYYFLNFKNEDGYWEMIAAKPTRDKLTILCIDAKTKEDIQAVNNVIKKGKAKSLRKKNKYLIRPTKDELISLFRKDNICEKNVLTRLK